MSNSKANQYKELLKKQKEQTRTWKNDFERTAKKLNETNNTIFLLKQELERVRLRKWYQFWKFFKRNQIIS